MRQIYCLQNTRGTRCLAPPVIINRLHIQRAKTMVPAVNELKQQQHWARIGECHLALQHAVWHVILYRVISIISFLLRGASINAWMLDSTP